MIVVTVEQRSNLFLIRSNFIGVSKWLINCWGISNISLNNQAGLSMDVSVTWLVGHVHHDGLGVRGQCGCRQIIKIN
jgi:hypothetical protein